MNAQGLDIISLAKGGLHIGTYAFDGYVADMGSAAEYLKASMELQDRNIRRELFNPDRQIYTKVHDTAPGLYADGSKVRASMVASGSIIEGEVENSVVFRSARIEKGAVVEYAIIGENVTIEAGATVGAAPDGSEAWGVATCGPNVHVSAGASVPAGAMIYSGEEV